MIGEIGCADVSWISAHVLDSLSLARYSFGDRISLAHLKRLLDLSTDAEHFLQLVRDAL
jgi:hypothetical protein